jgi:hypothetical protein
MNTFFLHPANRAWLVLLVATGVTWWLGDVGAAGTDAILAMLAIVFIKGRLVILDFMELRGTPPMWRLLFEGWLILVGGLILLAYASGPATSTSPKSMAPRRCRKQECMSQDVNPTSVLVKRGSPGQVPNGSTRIRQPSGTDPSICLRDTSNGERTWRNEWPS